MTEAENEPVATPYISQAVLLSLQTNCTNQTEPMPAGEEDAMRQRYLTILNEWEQVNASRNAQPSALDDVYKKILAMFTTTFGDIESAFTLGSEYNLADAAALEKPVILRLEERNYTVDNNYQTIGRLALADIQFQCAANTSRIHAFVRRFGKFVLVLDVGSHSGVKCISRSNKTDPCQVSVLHDRRPLIFRADETVVFHLGSASVVLNPLQCVIESDVCTVYRNFIGACGHFICCMACATEWRKHDTSCPTCREPFFGPEAQPNRFHMQSFVGASPEK